MKNLLFLIILIPLILSCNSFENKENSNLSILEPEENIKALLDSFLIENNRIDSIYELYIQRITPWENDKFEPTTTDIIIYGGRYSLTKRKREPVMAVKVDNVKFFVYSGIENYFSKKYDYIQEDREEEPYGNIWIIRDSADVYTHFIKTTLQAPPPSEIPSDIKFIPPTIED
jgi:hypothetical protein